MTDWKPIETAPKDGTRILAWDGKDVTTVAWKCYSKHWCVWALICSGPYADDESWEPTMWADCPIGPE